MVACSAPGEGPISAPSAGPAVAPAAVEVASASAQPLWLGLSALSRPCRAESRRRCACYGWPFPVLSAPAGAHGRLAGHPGRCRTDFDHPCPSPTRADHDSAGARSAAAACSASAGVRRARVLRREDGEGIGLLFGLVEGIILFNLK